MQDDKQQTSNVDYSAGLDPGAVNAQGPDPSFNPMEDAIAIRSMFGAIHNELNQVNENLVDPSVNLKAKQVNKTVMDRDILNIVGVTPEQQPVPQNIPQPFQPQPVPPPQQTGQLEIPQVDPNQLELNFDNSATANKIFEKLDDIERKLIKIESKLNSLVDKKK